MNRSKLSFAVAFILSLSLTSAVLARSTDAGAAATKRVRRPRLPKFAPPPLPAAAGGFYNNADGSPLIPLIASASASLEIEIYEMDDLNVRTAIRTALARGVRVRIIKDPSPLGAGCDVFAAAPLKNTPDCQDQRSLVVEINAAAGGRYVPFVKAELCGSGAGGKSISCYEHGKIAIADGASALISTGNFNPTNLCDRALKPTTCNRDYSYISVDPEVVGTLTAIFEKDLLGRRYDVASLISASAAAKMTVSPLSLPPLVAFIESAKSTLQIQNQYLKEPTLNAAIIAAARRGVQVSVMVSSLCSFSKPTPGAAAEAERTLGAMEQAGASVRLFTRRILVDGVAGYLHAKAIVVDEGRAWIGSVNGSTLSVASNREYGVFFDRPEQVAALSALMTRDQADENAESWQESLTCAKDGMSLAPGLLSIHAN